MESFGESSHFSNAGRFRSAGEKVGAILVRGRLCFVLSLLAAGHVPASAAGRKPIPPPVADEFVVSTPEIEPVVPIVVDDGKRRLGATTRTPDPTGPEQAQRGPVQIGTGRFLGNPRRAAAPAAAEPGTHTLNLSEVTVQEAAAAVLGDILRVNYTIDPKIEGRITLQTTNPVSRSGAVELFMTALRSVGAAMVQNGNVVRVVPLDQATAGARIATSDRGQPPVGSGVRVIPLKYVAAADMKRLLEPIASYGGSSGSIRPATRWSCLAARRRSPRSATRSPCSTSTS